MDAAFIRSRKFHDFNCLNMRLGKLLFGRSSGSAPGTVITFTGGMGAQIISAAIYFFLKNRGDAVFADLSYFNRTPHVATPGKSGDISYWPWQLDAFDLSPDSFGVLESYSRRDVRLIEDGLEKLELALKALSQPEVRKYFAIPEDVTDVLPVGESPDYLCIHVRRGDYVNVASHLVTDRQFIGLAAKFSGLVKHLVVVSDSPIGADFRQMISTGFEQAVFLDNIDAFASHRVMRSARILICSNSQFSLIAAMLNTRALVIVPKQWFGIKDRVLEKPINEACDFQVLG